MKKLTHTDFIQRVTEKHPTLDFSKFTYVNWAGKGQVICPVHGEYTVSAGTLLNGHGCSKCYHERKVGVFKDGLAEFIAKARSVHGDKYDYSSTVYAGAKKKLNILCPEHGEFSQEAYAHTKGKGCPKCGLEVIGSRVSLTHEQYMAALLEARPDMPYDLSKVAYTRLKNKITVVCKQHGEFTPTAGNFLTNKSGCPECGKIATGLASRTPEDKLLAELHKVHSGRYHYIGFEYKRGKRYANAVCPVHGFFSQLVSDHKRGSGCWKCQIDVYNTETFITKARKVHGDSYDYSRVEYIDAFKHVEIVCPEHGSFMQGPTYHVNNGYGCPRCANVGPSKGQLELAELLKPYVNVEVEAWVGQYRADIVIPFRRMVIEYHGLVWHSERFMEDPQRDYKKYKLLTENGWRVIHIFEDEFATRKKQVVDLVLTAIGITFSKVYARTGSVVLVSDAEANDFHEEFHIQGGIPAGGKHYGLEVAGELHAVMSFTRVTSNRGTKSSDSCVELRRFSSKGRVVGGASRLLSHFLRDHPGTEEVVSYSDNRLFTGEMYKALGFSVADKLGPDYYYISPRSRKRMPKRTFAKDRAASVPGFKFDSALTEVENAHANGWYRLYDCGKTKWVLSV